MNVELLVNLKVPDGRTIPSGAMFDDEHGQPIPDFVLRRLKRGMARVIASKTSTPVLPGPKTEVGVIKPVPEKEAEKKEDVKKAKIPPRIKKLLEKKKA